MSDKDKNEYGEIISDAIDDLNVRGDFSGTNIEQAPKTQTQKKGLLADRPLLTLLTLLAGVSAITYVALMLTKEPVMSAGDAAAELERAISAADVPEEAKKAARDFVSSVVTTNPTNVESAEQAIAAIRSTADGTELDLSALDRMESVEQTADGGVDVVFQEPGDEPS